MKLPHFHLITLLLTTITLGAILGLNFAPRHLEYDEFGSIHDAGFPCNYAVTSKEYLEKLEDRRRYVRIKELTLPPLYEKDPYSFEDHYLARTIDEAPKSLCLAINLVFALFTIVSVTVSSELLARRARRKRQTDTQVHTV